MAAQVRLSAWTTYRDSKGAKITMTKPNTGAGENLEFAITCTTKASFKKPYQSPHLKMFGSIQEMTRTAGHHGHYDGGHSWKYRTH